MKKLFAFLSNFLKLLFGNPEKWINDNVTPSIALVNNIKAIVDSPFAMALTAIIPGNVDDIIRQKISDNLQIAINKLSNIYDIKNESNQIIKLHKFIEWLKTLSPDTKNAIYIKLASIISNLNDTEGNIKEHISDLMVQTAFTKLKQEGHLNELNEPEEIVESGVGVAGNGSYEGVSVVLGIDGNNNDRYTPY